MSILKRYISVASLALLITLAVGGGSAAAESVSVLLSEAADARDAGDLRTEIIDLRNAAKQAPDNGEVRLLLGRAQLKNKDYKGAIKELRRALKAGGSWSDIIPDLAEALLADEQAAEVIAEIGGGGVSPADAQYPRLMLLSAAAYEALGEFDSAEDSYRKVLKAVPGDPRALRGLASVAFAQRKRAEARAYLDLALARAPNDARIQYQLAELERVEGRYVDAEVNYRHALKASPAMIEARIGLAWALMLQGKDEAAKKEVAAIYEKYPKGPAANHLRGALAYRAGDYADAERYLQIALNGMPGNPAIKMMLAVNHFAQKNYEQADVLLREILSDYPSYSLARNLSLEIQFRTSSPDRLLRDLQRIGPSVTEQDKLYHLMASAAAKSGDLAEAGQYLANAIELSDERDSEAYRQAAKLVSEGNAKGALRILDAAQRQAASETVVPRADVDAIQGLINADKLEQALKAATALVGTYPTKAVARNQLAAVLLAQHDVAGARENFEQALQLEPKNPTGAMNLARLSLATKDLEAAEKYYKKVLALAPGSVRALQGLAEVALTKGDLDAAAAWFDKACDADVAAVAPRLNLARVYLRLGKPAPALAMALEAEALSPVDPLVVTVVGDAYRAVGLNVDAVTHFEDMSRRFPESVELYLELARAYWTLGRANAASSAIDQALVHEPGNLTAATIGIKLALSDGKTERALHLAGEIAKQHPKRAEGYSYAGDILLQAGDYKAAEKAYASAFQRDPSAQMATKLVTARLEKGMGKEALTPLQTWVAAHPQDILARHYLAQAYLRVDESGQALAEYHHIIDLQPDNSLALNNLAAELTRRGQAKQAVAFARRAYELEPSSAIVADTLGWALVQSGDPKAGIEPLRNAVTTQADKPVYLYHLAVALEANGDPGAAIEALQRALASSGEFAAREQARKQLSRLQSGAR